MTRDEALNKTIAVLTYHQVNFCKSKEAVANMNEIIEALEMIDKEQCGDCISREKALQIIRAWFDREATPSDLKNEIEQLPPVTPQPKTGKWIYRKEEDSYRCSLCTFPCHKDNMGAIPTRYCAGCGAKMENEIQSRLVKDLVKD